MSSTAASDASDSELIEALRDGDRTAMGHLYGRHHDDALRVARIVGGPGDAEDLVAEAFARVLAQIVDDKGPIYSFRPYLHTVIRNLRVERARHADRERTASDRPWLFEGGAESAEEPDHLAEIDAGRAARAMQTLPERWRRVLWQLEVEGRKPAELSADLSLPPSAVYALTHRAREGLRLAYLDQHVPQAVDDRCTWTRERMARLARGALSARALHKAHGHLEECAECAALYASLHQLNGRLGASVWPVVLLGGATVPLAPAVVPTNGFSEPPAGDAGSVPTPADDPGSVLRGLQSSSRSTSRHASAAGRGAARSGARRALNPATWASSSMLTATTATLVAVIGVAALLGASLQPTDPKAEVPTTFSTPEPRTDAPQGRLPSPVPPERTGPPWPDVPAAAPLDTPSVLTAVAERRDLVAEGQKLAVTARPGPGPGAAEPPLEPSPEPDAEPGPELEPEPEPEPGVGLGTVTADPVSPSDEGLARWRLAVPVTAGSADGAPFTIELTLALATPKGFTPWGPDDRHGWDCGGIEDGGRGGAPYYFQTRTCTYDFQPGQPVPDFQVVLVEGGTVGDPLIGEVVVTGAGTTDSATFSSPSGS
ncbi:sigma-70 family RNA polymerase sigma factor [Aeromicrobium sp. CTD01-1L150]|uniref:sigma-70 family RNA polymerase sigma factor n=1 Tax=Aeromicrobium sp. CTD01-1L150 TaxID=3341830 RepID=UPI0035C0370D